MGSGCAECGDDGYKTLGKKVKKPNKQLADLFFNHSHPVVEELYHGTSKDTHSTRQKLMWAFIEEAQNFLDNYKDIFSCDIPTAIELAFDSYERI